MPSLQDNFITRADLPAGITSGHIGGANYKQALDFFRNSADWDKWALGALFALGIGHILAGIIFFFAFNWNDLSGPMKFSIVQGGIVLSILAWLALRLDRLPAQAFGIATTVLVGVLLAVFGQVYQTPAAIYTPFILWAALSFPFAAASRSVAHWAVWLAIAVVAALTYIGDGLEPTSGDKAARWALLFVSVTLLCLSAFYHWLSQNKFVWAQTSWFRLSILMTAALLLFGLFVESFWDSDFHFVWILSLAITVAALAVIYFRWPTLPALSLVTFTVAAMVSQFGFRLIFEVLDFTSRFDIMVFQMLLCFGWTLGITFALAKAFRFYQTRFGSEPKELNVKENKAGNPRHTLEGFTNFMGLDSAALKSVFAAEDEDAAPWYIETLLGIAGVITAIFALLLLGSFIGLFLSSGTLYPFAAFGIVVWAAAVFFRRSAASMFAKHFFNMFILAGGSLAVGTLAAELDWSLLFVVIGTLVSVITMVLIRDRIIEFIMALGIFALISFGLYELNVPRPFIVASILFPALAVLGLAWPLKSRLYDAAGTAFLLAVPIASATYEKSMTIEGLGLKANWLEISISLLVTIGAVVFLNRINKKQDTFRPPMGVFIPLLLAMAIMPLGSSAALLVVIVGYIFGSRALTLIGIVMQIYFLSWFYYDLQISLFYKSILLLISGFIFVGIWWFFRKIEEAVNV